MTANRLVQVPLIGPVNTLNAVLDPSHLGTREVQQLDNFDFDAGVLRSRLTNTVVGTAGSNWLTSVAAADVGQGMKWVVLNGTATLIAVFNGEFFSTQNLSASYATSLGSANYSFSVLTSANFSTSNPVSIEGTPDGKYVVFSDGRYTIVWDGSATPLRTDLMVTLPKPRYQYASEFSGGFNVFRMWNRYWTSCIDTSGNTSNYPIKLYPNIWQWSETSAWTTRTDNGGTVQLQLLADNQFRITDTGSSAATLMAEYPVGSCVAVYTGSAYFRGHVVAVASSGANMAEVTLEESPFAGNGYAYPVSLATNSYTRVKGLGGPLANGGDFGIDGRPWNWPIVHTGTVTDTSTTAFTVAANITATVAVGKHIKVVSGVSGTTFYGHVAAISYSAPNTTVTLHEANVPFPAWVGAATDTVSTAFGGPTSDIPAMQIVLKPTASVGDYVELFLGIGTGSGSATTSYDLTLDWSTAYQFAINGLEQVAGSLLAKYVKVGIGEASGTEIEFTDFSLASEWLWADLRYKQSTGAVIPSDSINDIKYIRFTVVTLPSSSDGNIYQPLYGFRATGQIPFSASYAAKQIRYFNEDQSKEIIARSNATVAGDFADSDRNTAVSTPTNIGFPPECLKMPIHPDFFYSNYLLCDPYAAFRMQVFRSDSAEDTYRLVLTRDSTSPATATPTRDDVTPDVLLSKEEIGSLTERSMPPAAVIFSHQGRMVCAGVYMADPEGLLSSKYENMQVWVSGWNQPFRYDTQVQVGSEAQTGDPFFFSLSSPLSGDQVVAGVSVSSGGQGRAVIASKERTFALLGSTLADFQLDSVADVGCIARYAMAAYRGQVFFVGSDRQLWVSSVGVQRIGGDEISSLLASPYTTGMTKNVSVGVADNKIKISVRLSATTGQTIYGDLAPVLPGSSVSWAAEPSGATFYECFASYSLYDNSAPLWGILKTYGGSAATNVARVHSASGTVTGVAVKSREFWVTGDYFLWDEVWIMCDKISGTNKTLTVTLYSDMNTSGTAYTKDIGGTGTAFVRIRVDSQTVQGRRFWMKIGTDVSTSGWRLYQAIANFRPVDNPERWSNV